ncbi:MAG: acyl-CoA thioesterase [Bdellovibrionaceae bacterium]|nr:acyl-CoA thioesterase [Bdellovibrio sp.]
MFTYKRKIHVYETDLMGIVHHSNYLRLCEEARVEWCLQSGVIDTSTESVFSLTVVETHVQHVKPARYGDEVVISLVVRTQGARLIFNYVIRAQDIILCRAETVHCSLDLNMNVKRLDHKIIKILENENG